MSCSIFIIFIHLFIYLYFLILGVRLWFVSFASLRIVNKVVVSRHFQLQGAIFKFHLLTRGKLFFRTRKPVRVIEFCVFSSVRITCF